MTNKPSIQHQCDHLDEICLYYERNIFTRDKNDKDQIKANNAAIKETFAWFKSNEQRIKSALAKPENTKPKPKHKDPTKHAATLCHDTSFQTFLKWKWDDKGWTFTLSDDPIERAAHIVRTLTKVKSRAEFSKNKAAASRWQQLFNQFKQWEKYGS